MKPDNVFDSTSAYLLLIFEFIQFLRAETITVNLLNIENVDTRRLADDSEA